MDPYGEYETVQQQWDGLKPQTLSSCVFLAYLDIWMLNFESHAPSKVPWHGPDELGIGNDTLLDLDSLMDPLEDMNQCSINGWPQRA